MFQGERVRLRAFEIENSDETVAQQKRHNQFRTCHDTVITVEVTRIFRDVINPENASLARSRSGEPFVQRDAPFGLMTSWKIRVTSTVITVSWHVLNWL